MFKKYDYCDECGYEVPFTAKNKLFWCSDGLYRCANCLQQKQIEDPSIEVINDFWRYLENEEDDFILKRRNRNENVNL